MDIIYKGFRTASFTAVIALSLDNDLSSIFNIQLNFLKSCHSLQNCKKTLKKYILCTIYITTYYVEVNYYVQTGEYIHAVNCILLSNYISKKEICSCNTRHYWKNDSSSLHVYDIYPKREFSTKL